MQREPASYRLLIRLCLTAVILAYVFSVVPFPVVAAELARADLRYVFACWLVFVAVLFVAAIQLGYLIRPQGIQLGLFALFRIDLAAQFYAMTTPFGPAASTLARWYKLSRHAGQRSEALAALIMNRLLEFLALTSISVLAWWLDSSPGKVLNVIIVVAVVLAGLIAVYATGSSVSAHALLEKHVYSQVTRVPVIGASIVKVFEALARYSGLPLLVHLRFWVMTAGKNLLGIVGLYLLSRALNMDISFVTIAWVRSVTSILTFVPVSFAGLGVREAGFLLLMKPLGVAEADAVALGLLHFTALLFCASLGGLSELKAMRWRRAQQ